MSSPAKRRRERLTRRRRKAQEAAIEEDRARRKRWGDGQVFGPGADLPPMKDVTYSARAAAPWPQVVRRA